MLNFKRDQIRLESNHLALLIQIRDTLCILVKLKAIHLWRNLSFVVRFFEECVKQCEAARLIYFPKNRDY
jgi:hypothetical protein